jgi:hypothetical protein
LKIEFRKIPLQDTEFEISSNSVKFLGTFCKISSKLARINANISGSYDVDCCKCGKDLTLDTNMDVDFLVSDGIYSSSSNDEESIIIEVEDHFMNFNEILHSEIESLKSEYHVCDTCKNNDTLVEKEY